MSRAGNLDNARTDLQRAQVRLAALRRENDTSALGAAKIFNAERAVVLLQRDVNRIKAERCAGDEPEDRE